MEVDMKEISKMILKKEKESIIISMVTEKWVIICKIENLEFMLL